MRKEKYLEILQNNVSIRKLHYSQLFTTFQQDNDSKHTLKIFWDFVEERRATGDISLMMWPAQLTIIIVVKGWAEQKSKNKTTTELSTALSILAESLAANWPHQLHRKINKQDLKSRDMDQWRTYPWKKLNLIMCQMNNFETYCLYIHIIIVEYTYFVCK